MDSSIFLSFKCIIIHYRRAHVEHIHQSECSQTQDSGVGAAQTLCMLFNALHFECMSSNVMKSAASLCNNLALKHRHLPLACSLDLQRCFSLSRWHICHHRGQKLPSFIPTKHFRVPLRIQFAHNQIWGHFATLHLAPESDQTLAELPWELHITHKF